jgi:GxxExxY protein
LNTDAESEERLPHADITREIIGAAFEVHQQLGYGFLERVYQRALQVELQRGGLQAELEHKIQVRYKGVIGGDFEADLFVGHAVMVEIKVAPQYNPSDAAQLLNELKATGVKVSLLINFGRAKVEFKRLVF